MENNEDKYTKIISRLQQDYQGKESFLKDYSYELVGNQEKNQIGKGAFGLVYRGFNNITKEKVAIKEMFFKLKSDLLDQFSSDQLKEPIEWRIKKLVGSHSNIIDVQNVYFCVNNDEGNSEKYTVLIVMELAQCSLDDILKENKIKEHQAEALIIGYQILQGLNHLKVKSISHRDIKPQNILQGIDGQYKLADFGTFRENNSHQALQTMMSMVQGTLIFMSPEARKIVSEFQNDEKGDKYIEINYNVYKADVYSVGLVILCVLLEQSSKRFDKIKGLNEGKVKLQDIVSKNQHLFSSELSEVLGGMLQFKEDDRFDIDKSLNHPCFNLVRIYEQRLKDSLQQNYNQQQIQQEQQTFKEKIKKLEEDRDIQLTLKKKIQEDSNILFEKNYQLEKKLTDAQNVLLKNLPYQNYIFQNNSCKLATDIGPLVDRYIYKRWFLFNIDNTLLKWVSSFFVIVFSVLLFFLFSSLQCVFLTVIGLILSFVWINSWSWRKYQGMQATKCGALKGRLLCKTCFNNLREDLKKFKLSPNSYFYKNN